MIHTIRIRNFITVEDIHIHFHEGMNVITGETGAGKSLIIKAISLALGERMDWELMTDERSTIELVMSIPEKGLELLRKYGIEPEGDTVIVRRIFDSKLRRSRTYMNDNLVVARTANELLSAFVEIQGQYDTYKLFDEDYHIELIDRFAKSKFFREDYQMSVIDRYANNEDILTLFKETYKLWKKKRNEYERALEEYERYRKELDILKYQLQELEQAQLRQGEEEELLERLEYLNRLERIEQAKQTLKHTLYEDESSVHAKISYLLRSLEDLNDIREFSEISSSLEDVLDRVSEIYHSLEGNENYDPQEIDSIQERLYFLNKLKRKYGRSIDELITYKKELEERIDYLESLPNNLSNLEKELERIEGRLKELAHELTLSRKRASKQFEKEVVSHLRTLGLSEARFKVKLEEVELSERGKDRIYFMFSSSKELPLKPLKKVASGGELSRLALSIKLIVAGKEEPSTLIFDEIDTGIGGETAMMVGRKLKELSRNYQLIVITHLPQIASFADAHFTVHRKHGSTTVRKVEGEERIREIARMLSGMVSEESLLNAKKLLSMV